MNILIVDDEPLIHLSIERLIKDCEADAAIYHANNGRQMLALLTETPIDLAYVDIKMPGLSGLEAIRQARELAPSTRYYIMTGFDEFEYAKQAVKLKVEDYLMKPLDRQTVRETLAATRLQLKEQNEHLKDALRSWLEAALAGHGRALALPGPADTSLAFLSVLPDGNAFSASGAAALLSAYDGQMVSVPDGSGFFVCLFGRPFAAVHEALKSLCALALPESVTCIASPVLAAGGDLHGELARLRRLAPLRAALGTGRFCYAKILESELNERPELLPLCEDCAAWQDAFRSRNYDAFSALSRRLCAKLPESPAAAPFTARFLSFFALVLGIEKGSLCSPSSLAEVFERAAKTLLSPVGDTRGEDISRFIQAHFCEDLTAADLSETFGLSANSINSLLKAAVVLRYGEYVTSLRLSRAKKLLLSTAMSIKEITAECGYYSQSHFTRLFADHEGCTPAEYRRRGAPEHA